MSQRNLILNGKTEGDKWEQNLGAESHAESLGYGMVKVVAGTGLAGKS